MNLCSDGHEEVCYETRNCPCCESIKDKDADIEKLGETIANLEGEIKELEKKTG
jgi:hypothetical protein